MHKIVTARIALIPDDAWQPVADYPDSGVCELAETTLGDDRLIVRRVHLHAQDDQAELFTYWRHSRLHHQPHRADRTSSTQSTASTPKSSSSSATSKTRRSRTSPPGTTAPTAPGP